MTHTDRSVPETKGVDVASARLRPEPSGRSLLQKCLAMFEGLAKDVDACSHLSDDFCQPSICTELRQHLAKPDQSIFQRLYDCEINFSISSFWDGGFTVKLGDEMNGFKAEACVDTMQEAEAWLSGEASTRYPGSLPEHADANKNARELAEAREEIERLRDFGSDAVDLAGRVLENLGIGQDASKEPGADRRRDRIAAMIERAVSAHAESLTLSRDEALEALRVERERVGELSAALKDLCDAWDDKNDGGTYRGNVTKAQRAARSVLAQGDGR